MNKDFSEYNNKLMDFFNYDKKSLDELIKDSEKLLGKGWFDRLTTYTDDKIKIRPLYSEVEERNDSLLVNRERYLKSIKNQWDIRCLSSHPEPKKANKKIIDDLEKGATSITIKLDPTGNNGTIVKNKSDLEDLLENVYMDLAPIHLETTGPSLPYAACLLELLERKIKNRDNFFGNLGIDPISSLSSNGSLISNYKVLHERISDLTEYSTQKFKNTRVFNVRTLAYHSAGCSEAQELAIAMSTALNYVKLLNENGFNINKAFQQIAFTITCDTDFFLTISKFKAIRLLWQNIARECGAETKNYSAPTYAITAPRMMATTDPWTNILRCTTACFAATISGADAITVLPFDYHENKTSQNDMSRRISRNTQLILQDESHLDQVIDPSAGSYLVESLTTELAKKSWEIFTEIEKTGGIQESLFSGFIQNKIEKVKKSRANAIARREKFLTGVNDYPIKFKKSIKISDNSNKSIRAKENFIKNLPLPKPYKGTLTKNIIDYIKNDVLINQITNSLIEDPIKITALEEYRLSEDFEKVIKLTRNNISIFIYNFGENKDYLNKFSYVKNIMEIGGLNIITKNKIKDNNDLVNSFTKSKAKVCIICSSEKNYMKYGESLVEQLKTAGALKVYLVGPLDGNRIEKINYGLDNLISKDCDILSLLKDIYKYSDIKI